MSICTRLKNQRDTSIKMKYKDPISLDVIVEVYLTVAYSISSGFFLSNHLIEEQGKRREFISVLYRILEFFKSRTMNCYVYK